MEFAPDDFNIVSPEPISSSADSDSRCKRIRPFVRRLACGAGSLGRKSGASECMWHHQKNALIL